MKYNLIKIQQGIFYLKMYENKEWYISVVTHIFEFIQIIDVPMVITQ